MIAAVRSGIASASALGCVAVVVIASLHPAASGQTVRFTRKQLFVGPHENAAVADLNRDGRPDIVYGPYWFAAPDFVPRTYRANHAAADYVRENSSHVLDVDGDGWPDIIAGGWTEDGIWWFKNPGNGAAERGRPWEVNLPWKASRLAKTRGTMEMFALHDFDGDGLPELHSANYRKQAPLEIWRWTKNADGTPALTPFVLGPDGGGHGYAFGDVNGDVREDLLTEIGWYERPAGDPSRRPGSFTQRRHFRTRVVRSSSRISMATGGSTSSSAAATTWAFIGGSSRRRVVMVPLRGSRTRLTNPGRRHTRSHLRISMAMARRS